MQLQEKIEALDYLGNLILRGDERIDASVISAYQKNPWFVKENSYKSLEAIAHKFLNKDLLLSWIEKYHLDNIVSKKRIGLVPAGNIPLVGLHDIICIFLTDNLSVVKYSEKDQVLIPALLKCMIEKHPVSASYFEQVDRLENIDGVIATGSNNTSRYFDYYFSKYPHIIRRNRNAVAILDGKESAEDLGKFSSDVSSYFGLGCRNVSKVYLPKDYKRELLMDHLLKDSEMIHHNKYKNNYDYNFAIYLLNKDEFLTNNKIILRKDKAIASRIACLHYEEYSDLNLLEKQLQEQKDEIQCVVSNAEVEGLELIPLGSAQQPNLSDYADGVDTIQFLLSID
jgi:hypothetical protein